MKKIYSAFLSSNYTSLIGERQEAINVLLDFRILPIGMEHFTVSTNGEFSDIEELIDDSDFFIMLMGERYGSCDSDGISWTEREYRYALNKDKAIIVIVCDELINLLKADPATLTEDQKKQIEFYNRIPGYMREVSENFCIKDIIRSFLQTYSFSKCTGWSRIENIESNEKKLAEWRNNNKAVDISGIWYHVHLSEEDEAYIRTGTIKIEQEFFPNKYQTLHMDGHNYNVRYYDANTQSIIEDKMKSSRFVGEYTLQENGEIFGIFNSKRTFSSEFNSLEVNKGNRRGIHDFTIDTSSMSTETLSFEGEFHDEAPSPKQGRIFLFRNLSDRNEFLLENRQHILERE